MQSFYHSYANKTNFRMKSFALSLAFMMRFKATRKWPITVRTRKASTLELFLESCCVATEKWVTTASYTIFLLVCCCSCCRFWCFDRPFDLSQYNIATSNESFKIQSILTVERDHLLVAKIFPFFVKPYPLISFLNPVKLLSYLFILLK